jgi:hypothetical protein
MHRCSVNILKRIRRINPQAGRRLGHQLREPNRPGRRNRITPPRRLHRNQRDE